MPKTKPPGLRISYDPRKNCGKCSWYHSDGLSKELLKSGSCAMYHGYRIGSHETCDEIEIGDPGSKGKIRGGME